MHYLIKLIKLDDRGVAMYGNRWQGHSLNVYTSDEVSLILHGGKFVVIDIIEVR